MTFVQMKPVGSGKGWEWLTRILLIGVVLVYSSLYFDNTYPISEGWGVNYAELMFSGKMPYRDFYYYLPPLNLLIDSLFWQLSFGSLLAFRAWYLLQRVVIYVMIFNLLKRYFHHAYVFVACSFAVVLCSGDVYDLLGDYNQTMSLLTIGLLYCAIGFVNADSLGKKLFRLFAAGLVLGLMFLNKQTIFLAAFITYFVTITALCIKRRDKNYLKYCLSVAGGMLIPMCAAAVWLFLNGAFIPFVEQVFMNVDGKGSLFAILVESISTRIFDAHLWTFIALGFGIAFIANVRRRSTEALLRRNLDKSMTILAAAMILAFGAVYKADIVGVLDVMKLHPKMTLAFLAGAAPYVLVEAIAMLRKADERKGVFELLRIVALFAGSVLVLTCTAINEEFSAKIYNWTTLFSYVQNDFSLWCMMSMVAVMVFSLLRCNRSRKAEHFLFIAAAGFSLYYGGIMATGTSAGPAHLFRMALPFLLCLIFSMNFSSKMASAAVKGGTWAVCLILSVACVAQKIDNSYSWWGSSMGPASQRVHTSEIPALKGIKMTAERKEQYETVTRLIEENSDEDAVVWGYPHNKLFNILTERYNMETFVPVLFYDVTADKYVLKELEMLKENLPDIVVWQDIRYCIDIHEEVFRGGEALKQREIMAYLEEVLPEKYTLIGAVGDVAVYRLNDGKEPAYTEISPDVCIWNHEYGVFDWEGDGHWCKQETDWNVRNPLPAAHDAQLYIYAEVGDGEAVGALEIRVNGERVKFIRIRPNDHVVELTLDMTLHSGDNLVEINTTTGPVETEHYFKLKGFSVQLVTE